MKQAVALVTAITALALPASALSAPQLGAPLPTPRASQTTPAPAPVAPLNTASNRTALNAYASYLGAVLKQVPAAQAAGSAYIAAISGQCRSALANLTQSGQQINADVQHTLTVLGREMGNDLSISFDQVAAPAFTRFANTLLRLHWTRASGAGPLIRRYVDAETTVLAVSQSDLCQDASFADITPDKVPANTRSFNRAYNRASAAANGTLANLLKLMQSFELPGEKALIARIASLASEISSVRRADLMQSGTSLAGALETT